MITVIHRFTGTTQKVSLSAFMNLDKRIYRQVKVKADPIIFRYNNGSEIVSVKQSEYWKTLTRGTYDI